MMSGEAWLYLLAVLINAVNLFLQVFFTIMYSDLEWYVSISLPGVLFEFSTRRAGRAEACDPSLTRRAGNGTGVTYMVKFMLILVSQ
jgi:hypothetical protein